jgi:hypothetical protein
MYADHVSDGRLQVALPRREEAIGGVAQSRRAGGGLDDSVWSA